MTTDRKLIKKIKSNSCWSVSEGNKTQHFGCFYIKIVYAVPKSIIICLSLKMHIILSLNNLTKENSSDIEFIDFKKLY